MNASFGMLSGPRLFFLFSFFIAFFTSLSVMIWPVSGCWFCSSRVSCTFVSIVRVHSSYPSVPGLAWYRFSKYWAMCSLFFSGSFISTPSSVIVSYSSSLSTLFFFLVSHIMLGLILALFVRFWILSSVILLSCFSISSLGSAWAFR